jgi:hypothetical protein
MVLKAWWCVERAPLSPPPPPPPQLSALTALGITHGQAAADTRMVGQLEGMRARADACSEAVSLVYMAPGR